MLPSDWLVSPTDDASVAGVLNSVLQSDIDDDVGEMKLLLSDDECSAWWRACCCCCCDCGVVTSLAGEHIGVELARGCIAAAAAACGVASPCCDR